MRRKRHTSTFGFKASTNILTQLQRTQLASRAELGSKVVKLGAANKT